MCALTAAVAATAPAIRPAGPDFRISFLGPEGSTQQGLDESFLDVAFNPRRNEYLAVFAADAEVDNDYEIFGQRLSAGGTRLGPRIRISKADAPGRGSTMPSATYNPRRNEYLVAFITDQLATDDEREVFGQRVSAAGALAGVNFRISNVGSDGVATRAPLQQSVAYDRGRDRYLVVFDGDGLATDNEYEIFGRLVSGAGVPVGADERLTTIGADGDASRDAFEPSVAFNGTRGEFVVAFRASGTAPLEYEIFSQRASGAGTPLGGEVRVSNIGADGDADRDASLPSLAFGGNGYVVVFKADGLAVEGEEEIFGHRLSGLGAPLGGDFRVSRVGADGATTARAGLSDVAYSPTGREYLVAYDAQGFATEGEYEIFTQRIGLGGRLLGRNTRLTRIGTDGDTGKIAVFPALTARTNASQYMTVFAANQPADDSFEAYGHRLASPRCGGRAATITGTGRRDKLRGTPGRDVIAGLGGNDTIRGLGRADLLCGGKGRDRLLGGRGPDRLLGGAGRDLCVGGPGRDRGLSCRVRRGIP